ncbi:MAG: hypothetical protein N2690_04855 [Rhodocyclaceae bacterium]|nr:hypothetical protein [Rhodocyclaceae bacterium]
MKKTLLSILAATFIGTHGVARAGGGLTGGALEITQLANNIELMAQVAEATQQTVQQINMLTTMLQNLRSLEKLTGVAKALGIETESLQSFINAYKGVSGALAALEKTKAAATRLGEGADSMASFYEEALKDLRQISTKEKTVPRDELNKIFAGMNQKQRDQARKILQQRLESLDAMKNDYDYLLQHSKDISKITGNVQGLQMLASQQINIQRLLLDNNTAFQTYLADLQAARVQEVEMREAKEREAHILLHDALQRARF